MSRSCKWLLIVTITLLGAFLRLYKIDSLPPGETYDPAYYGLDALTILDGHFPVFFETNFGREPLFSYIVAACVAVLGVGSTAIHVASALCGILTIPAVYLVADELFAEEKGLLKQFGPSLAALATALSFWHLSWSRYGVRAILTPLVAAMAMYALWHGMRTRRHSAFAWCGFWLGLGAYTYQASRVLPALVGVVLLRWLWAQRPPDASAAPVHLPPRRAWIPLLIVTLVAAAVASPLFVYSLKHGGNLTERIRQVSIWNDGGKESKLAALRQETIKTLQVFSFRGDTEPTTNIPGRPALNLFLSILFALGILISLFQLKRMPYLSLLLWLAIMCAPGVLAQFGPVAKRVIGSLPAVMLLIAVGALTPLDALRRRLAGRAPRTRSAVLALAASLVITGLACSGLRTFDDYFVTWGQDPALFTHFEAGLAAIGQYIGSRPPHERFYVSPVYVGHPSIRYNSKNREGIKGYNGNYCLVLPEANHEATTYIVVPNEDRHSLDELAAYLPAGGIVDYGPLHYGEPYFVVYRVPPDARPQIAPDQVAETNWANRIALVGYDVPADVPQPGETLQVRAYYRALGPMDVDYTAFIQLIGDPAPGHDSPLWSQNDSEPCRRYRPTSTWDRHEILADTLELAVPPDIAPGVYRVITGFYDWRTSERLPTLDETGTPTGDHATLFSITVPAE